MISLAAHRAALQAVPRKEYRIGPYENTPNGKGGHQAISRIASTRRYHKRQAGLIPPLEYGTLEQALKSLE